MIQVVLLLVQMGANNKSIKFLATWVLAVAVEAILEEQVCMECYKMPTILEEVQAEVIFLVVM